jgi:hypothetical protein
MAMLTRHWIYHTTRDCPVDPESFVNILLVGHEPDEREEWTALKAKHIQWNNKKRHASVKIVAYREAEEAKPVSIIDVALSNTMSNHFALPVKKNQIECLNEERLHEDQYRAIVAAVNCHDFLVQCVVMMTAMLNTRRAMHLSGKEIFLAKEIEELLNYINSETLDNNRNLR